MIYSIDDFPTKIMTILCFPKKLLIACLLMIVVSAVGCATTPEKVSAPADKLLLDGKKYFHEKKFLEAAEKFKQILDDHPDSEERVMALFLMADANYNRKEYAEAKMDYQRFVELYPAHEHVDRAQFFKAMSDFKVTDLASRDQLATRNALEAFDRLIISYPNSSYREKAIQKKNECLGMLARNLFEIGKYYFDSGVYQSAIKRLQAMLDLYPEQPYYDQAVFFIGESYNREQNFKMAAKAYNYLLEHYPKSLLVKDSRQRLKALPKS